MQRILITIAALLLFIPLAFAEDPSEIARQRNDQIARESDDLKKADAQIAEFEADLAKEEKASVALQATQTALVAEGKQLSKDGHDMMVRDKAYGTEVKQQTAECPKSTTDAALAQHCDTWKDKLDTEQKAIQLIRKNWTARKDKFLISKTNLESDMAANAKSVEHFKYSIPNMKVQRDRIVHNLQQINLDIKNCREAITSSTEEHMHAICGQMWDGNKMYPEFSPNPAPDGRP